MGRVSIVFSFAICMISIWQTCDALNPCPGPVLCTDNTPCKGDEACLLPRVGTQKRCRKCHCSDRTQCYTNVNGSVLCDCTSSPLDGPFCTCPPCLGSCPTGFVQYGGTCSCYAVSQYPINWSHAQKKCKLEGAFLAKISSDGENAFVVDLIKTMFNPPTEVSLWIGGIEVVAEGNWVWDMDGSPINGMYNRWTGSGPDNNITANCVDMLIYGGDDGLWHDNSCATSLHYVCEFNP